MATTGVRFVFIMKFVINEHYLDRRFGYLTKPYQLRILFII